MVHGPGLTVVTPCRYMPPFSLIFCCITGGTTIVCRRDQKERIIRYLQLGNPDFLPNPDGYLSEDLIERFHRESVYLADRLPDGDTMKRFYPYPDMMDFAFLDNDDSAKVTITIRDTHDGTYRVKDGLIEYILYANNKELELKFSGQSALPKIPEFGVTFLGTSNTFDENGLTSNQIIWAGRGIS